MRFKFPGADTVADYFMAAVQRMFPASDSPVSSYPRCSIVNDFHCCLCGAPIKITVEAVDIDYIVISCSDPFCKVDMPIAYKEQIQKLALGLVEGSLDLEVLPGPGSPDPAPFSRVH